MEFSTIIGIVIAMIFVMTGIGKDVGPFIDMPSVYITVGGTIGTVFIRFPVKMVLSFFKIYMKSMLVKLEEPEAMIRKIIALSVEAKKNGILGLEKVKIDNPFLKKGIQLAIDGVEPELIEAVLKIDVGSSSNRHDAANMMLVTCGDSAPAFGMIGTLIGLVQMLQNMEDPKSIGPAMAVAILTTLYGSVMSNIFFLPVADKLAYFHKEEMITKDLILNGVLSIANGDHPAVVQEKLASFLRPNLRKGIESTVKKG